jgi:hypothetical protein
MNMRRLLLTAALTLCPMLALADEHVAGQWRADLGHGVLINMDVLADGHWFSQTIQNDKVVAELAGTYEQTPTDDKSGKIVFTPLKSKVTAEHGPAKVESDTYVISDGGKVATISTGKETMVFHNTTAP